MPTPLHCQPLRSRRNQSENHRSSIGSTPLALSSRSSCFSHLQHLVMRPRTVEDLCPKLKSEKPIIINPCIVPKNPSTRTCKPSLCTSCQIACAKRRPTDVATTKVHQEPLLLKLKDLEPGSRVSINQYKSAVQGRLATTKGRESFGH
jgi:hypothetical protein